MQKLQAVDDAKNLLGEAARDWSVWRWLLEKRRVRTAADLAWEALEEAEKKVKNTWSDGLKRVYRELELAAALDGNPKVRKQYEKARQEAKDVEADSRALAERLRKADVEAFDLRMTAEETFDTAERHLSIPMARQGSEQAIEAYELREKFIRKAEAAARRK